MMEKRNKGAASLLLLLQLLWLKTSLASKPGSDCSKNCGDIDIPYPFGINDDECFRNEAFNLTCNSTYNPPKAFWRDHEVVKISLLGEMIISTGFSYDCYNSTGPQDSSSRKIELAKDLPFSFSAARNKFTAIGCDTIALITGSWGPNFLSGCVSYCGDAQSLTNGSCSGNGCCQSSIPEGVKKLKMAIGSVENHTSVLDLNPCSYAFFVEEKQYSFLVSDMAKGSLEGRMSTVRTVLDWAIKNETCALAKEATDYACVSDNSYCDNSDIGYRCHCSHGYQGNPYLLGLEGCQDIDECSNNNGGCQQACTNLQGSHSCSCWNGYHLDEDRKTCIENPPNKKEVPVLTVTLAFGLSLLFLLISTSWAYWAWNKRKLIKLKEEFFERNGGLLLQEKISSHQTYAEAFKIFTTEELKKATDNYNESRVIGQGGFGTVYKGILLDQRIVAVKKSKIVDKTQIEQFINEVLILSQINHRNVVKLLGCCLEDEVPSLVYEFISNGTLSDHIHGQGQASPISLENRLRIAAETAGALYYLHSAAAIPIIHRDVKSTNILLDNNFTAKVSDFGASRLAPLDQTQINTLVQGTWGYVDPESFQTGQLTEKSDIYSFGVVLVELLTGEMAVSSSRSHDMKSLSVYFLSSVKENRLFEILEDRVRDEGEAEQLIAIAQVAKRCLNLRGEERPSMKEVVVDLEGLRRIHEHPWELKNPEEAENLLGESSHGYTGNTTVEHSMQGHIISALEMER